MSSIPATSPTRLADQLDAVGQRYRGQRLLRGAMLWLAVSAIATGAAVLIAHLAANIGAGSSGGAGRWLTLIPLIWAAILLAAGARWILTPLLWAPQSMAIAALLESRLPGLHNGPTNALHLARDDSLAAAPWRDAITAEIESTLHIRPLQNATPWTDLRPPALASAATLLLLGLSALLFPAAFAHGWQQMFHPASFIPQAGAARLIDIHPGDATLVAGQPLDITADVTLPAPPSNATVSPPPATLIFAGAAMPAATLTAAATSPPDSITLHYNDHFDHIDRSFRYRLEIAGTQSPWFTATVVQQIQLTSMTLKLSPPPYLRAASTVQTFTASQLPAASLSAPQGTTVQLSAGIDVPVAGALLQRGQDAPAAMSATPERTSFEAVPFTLATDTPLALLLTDGSSQVIATLPAQPLTLHAIADAAPTVQMRWPRQDTTAAPTDPLRVVAHLADDHGLTAARVLLATDSTAPLAPIATFTYANLPSVDLQTPLDIPAAARRHGNVIRIQVEATDNRQLPDLGPQTTSSAVLQISFEDPAILAQQQQADGDRLNALLLQMLKTQQDLAAATPAALAPAAPATQPTAAADALLPIRTGQTDLRASFTTIAQTYPFTPLQQVVQKTLQVLALNPAKDAVDSCDALLAAPLAARPTSPAAPVLQAAQRRIIDTLQSLLAGLGEAAQPTTAPAHSRGGQLASTPDDFKKLDQTLRQFMAQQQSILDQTTSLAKVPVDNFSAADKQALANLRQQQDDLDAFLRAKLNDLSMLPDQDFSNPSLAKDLATVLDEVTMAKGALASQSVTTAVPAEENGIALADEITNNLERWLGNGPDRKTWTQEDLGEKFDAPASDLPAKLQDMVGQLMEQEEDLLDTAQQMNANLVNSGNKDDGWDAMDGPISDMSAKGLTGNVLPKNNAVGGRSGEGRSGQSEGEFVDDSAIGKGGRRTPTRLDPTAFTKGQINDTSKDPTGGATGGGKLSGEGALGLQGSAPSAVQQGLHRLATQQAEIRNAADRLNLQLGLSRYDNFKLTQSILLMRRIESDFDSNRYRTALRTRDVLLDDLATSRTLLAGQVHVQQDTTPTTTLKQQQQLDDAAKADLPPAWSEPLKQYYQKLAAQSQ